MTVVDKYYPYLRHDVFYDGVANLEDTDAEHEIYTFRQLSGFLKTRFAAVNVEFGNRWMVVTWDDQWDSPTGGEAYVSRILEDGYYSWMHLDECPEAEEYCCEEWLLKQIDDPWPRFCYRVIYVSEFELTDQLCDLERKLSEAKEEIKHG